MQLEQFNLTLLCRAANNFFHLEGHVLLRHHHGRTTKFWSDITKNKRLNFIHCCRKMIFDQKIVWTSCLNTLGISLDMSKFWSADVQ